MRLCRGAVDARRASSGAALDRKQLCDAVVELLHKRLVAVARVEHDFLESAIRHVLAMGDVPQPANDVIDIGEIAPERNVMAVSVEDPGVTFLIQHLDRLARRGLQVPG